MRATRVFVIILPGIVALAVATWFGWTAFGSDSAAGQTREFTYRNVSLTLPPEASGLRAVADYAPPESGDKPGGGPVVVVRDVSEARSGYIVIDANTGGVLVDTIAGALRDEADGVLASIREPDGQATTWPLADVAPPRGREATWGNITYVQPDAQSGIFVLPVQGGGPGGAGVGLFIHNGVSRMTVDGSTGDIDTSLVLEQDRDVFRRLAAVITVEPTG
jgi:hypothetical protein